MELSTFHVDAFAEHVFEGNPAAVCVLPRWLPDATLQAIAAENALSETAFVLSQAEPFPLRWFTPRAEVELCGHATLAAAHVILGDGGEDGRVEFDTRSGRVSVERRGRDLTLDFPARPVTPAETDAELTDIARGGSEGPVPVERLTNERTELLVYERQGDVEALAPDFPALRARERPYLIATAPGEEHDFVSRFFAPAVGVDEDPVTGSAHTSLAPYWAQRLGDRSLRARQVSERGGELVCRVAGERVLITGRCVTYSRGRCHVPESDCPEIECPENDQWTSGATSS